MFKTDDLSAPELFSCLLTLRPLEDSVIPVGHGHWAYALALRLLGTSTASLTEELHSSDGLKPFTVSLLHGHLSRRKGEVMLNREVRASLRLTFLRGSLFAHFLDGVLRWGDAEIQLGPAYFRVEKVETCPMSTNTASFNTYLGIITRASCDRHIELELISPTAFRSGGKRNVLLPEARLVFGSYLNRWREFSPVEVEDVTPWLDEIILSRYRLRTSILDFGFYQETGFIGKCRFELASDIPENVAKSLNALADFAFYCGTGAKTTMGMGQTRRGITGHAP